LKELKYLDYSLISTQDKEQANNLHGEALRDIEN
jgi:hypothetical protein